MSKIFHYAIHYSYLEFPLGDKKEIKDQRVSLKKERKEIQNALKDMIPKEATKKKEDAPLRFYRQNPIPLIFFVNGIVHGLGKYLDTRYPEDNIGKKEEDIKRFWEDTYKKPYPKKNLYGQ